MPINLPVTILLIEDDPGHVRLIEINLRRALVTNDLVVLRDGQEAADYLFDTRHRGQQSAPWLILLDLNLPGLDGYQILLRLKTDERTKHIPVIILTTTDEQREIERCYALGCNVYITKPVEYAQFADAIRKLGLFLSVVKMPNGE
jgi:CheY-like chemotaxis protein